MKLKQASVLFVEDEPFLRETMGAWLKQKTGRVSCVANGAEALEFLAVNQADLEFAPHGERMAMQRLVIQFGGQLVIDCSRECRTETARF